MRKKTKRALTITIILMFILFAFITAFKQYYNFINKNVDSTIKKHFGQMINQSSTIINSHITSYFKIIESISTSIQEQDNLSENQMLSHIDNEYTHSLFENIGIIAPNGLSTTINNKQFDASKLEFFIDALKGTTNISITSFLETDNKLSCIYATPIFRKSKIIGVLFATINYDEFERILSSSFLESTNQNCIIDYSSNIIFKSGNNDKNFYLTKNKSNTAFYDNITDNGVLYKIKSDMQIKQSNVLGINNKGATYYLCYAPIGIQDWYFASLIKNDFVNKASRLIGSRTLTFLSIFAIFLISLLVFILILFNKSKESIRKTKLELETVIANIPGGVVRFSYDDCLTIEFLNGGLLNLTGYTKYEIKNILKNSFLNFVHQNDRQKLACAIVDQMTTNKTVEIDCRLQCNNGAYSWFLFKGRMIIDSNENCSCLCVLTDINDMKKAQQELNLSMQRYDIVTQQSDSILFEYSFIDKSIYLSEKWNKKFAYIPNESDFRLSAIQDKLIHPDDILIFEEIFTAIKNGQKYIEAQLRLYTLANKYIWCRLKASAIFDENGNVYKTVGKIIDIDQQKKETDLLKIKAEIDSLTGLYNKGTTKMLIDDFFNGEGKNGKHTLMILDIDNFKKINDSLGHLIGDSVITDITSKVKKLVRSSDICGRIGGDEFVILLKDTNNFDVHKANEICNAFRHTIFNDETSITVSCSIGISFYERDGTTYNELIRNADIALYEAKKNGKNRFLIYSQDMQF